MFRTAGISNFVIASALAFGLISCAGGAVSQPAAETPDTIEQIPFADAGPHEFDTDYDIWSDEARQRDIAVKIYSPREAGPFPAVIFSHGLGGSREALAYLGERLASWGIVAIHIQHPGSDRNVWAGLTDRSEIMNALRNAVRAPRVAIDRFLDMPFVLDEIERRVAIGTLPVDVAHIGVAGHSFGAHSALAAAGRIYPSSEGPVTFGDPRIVAGLLLSPPAPGPEASPASFPEAYGSVEIPLLHITGTNDRNPVDQRVTPRDRLIPFENIHTAPQYLIVFEEADHVVFSGRTRGRRRPPAWYPIVQADVQEAATAFFLAYLADNDEARNFLGGPLFVAAFDQQADVRRRLPGEVQ